MIYEACLSDVDATVEGPGGLEIFLHTLLKMFRDVMCSEEVLQIVGLRLIDGSSGVHSLDYRRHVAEDKRMHHR